MDAPVADRSRGRRPVSNNYATSTSTNFATDGQIANRFSTGARELKPFEFDLPTNPSVANIGGPRTGGRDAETFGDIRSSGKWDQFQVNQEKFGVLTSFDESQYTTTIDRSGADYKMREREAARLAAEIERKASSNVHIQEERNQRLPADMDEEAMYSGVQRPKSTPVPNSHVFNNKGRASHNGTNAVLPPHTARANKDQSSSGPTKQDFRPKNDARPKTAGPAKPPQKSAIPAKSVWGSKNHQSKAAAARSAPRSKNFKQSAVKGGASGKAAAATKAAPAGKAPPPTAKPATPATTKPSVPVSKTGPPPAAAKTAPQPSMPVMGPKSTPVGKKLSYAAAAGARVLKPAVATPTAPSAASTTADAAQGPRPPRSPMSPAKSGAAKPAAIPIPRGPARAQHAGRIPNGGRTPPSAARSPIVGRSTPTNPETSAMSALSLEAQREAQSPKIVKSFEQYKAQQVVKTFTENRQEITNDLKKFSTDLAAKSASRKSNGTSAAAVKSESLSVDSKNVVPANAKTDLSETDKPKAVSEKKGAGKEGETTSTKRKVKKLNANATAWVPGSGSWQPSGSATPAPSTSTPAPSQPAQFPPGAVQGAQGVPTSPLVDPYVMGNFGGVSPVPPPDHQVPNMGFQMGPPVAHPGNMSYGGYPSMMVPPGMAQGPAAFQYMAGARNPYLVPGPGGRFPPGGPAPNGMSFGIPVSMIPPNQGRTPGMPQYYNPQYMHGQPPVQMQAAMPPYAHAQQMAPPVVSSPRNSIGGNSGGGRRSGSKGRGRHQHHQQNFGGDHQSSGPNPQLGHQQQSIPAKSGYVGAPVSHPANQKPWTPATQQEKGATKESKEASAGAAGNVSKVQQ